MTTDLIRQALAGNQLALEKLLKDHYRQLYKTAFIYVKNEEAALDIVQESVIKIMNKLGTLKQPEYFATWAVRIVIRTSLDHLRQKERRQESSLEMEADFEVETNLTEAEKLDIHEGLSRLPENLQEMTILYYFHGIKIRELSELYGQPVGTIKGKLHQGRQILRDYLEGGEFT